MLLQCLFFGSISFIDHKLYENLYLYHGSPTSEGSLNMNVGGIWRIRCISSLDQIKSVLQNIEQDEVFEAPSVLWKKKLLERVNREPEKDLREKDGTSRGLCAVRTDRLCDTLSS